jgi:hypothetical protein
MLVQKVIGIILDGSRFLIRLLSGVFTAMQKIRLDLSALRVESFASTSVPAGRGTVAARSEAYTVDFPYSMCVSDPYSEDPRHGCATGQQLNTCDYTGCACDQDDDQTETCGDPRSPLG